MKKTLISRLAAAVGGLALLLMPLLAAPPPGVLNHQGRLVVNGENYTGTGHFKFALVDAAGTARYWSNDGTGSGGGPPTAAVQAAVSEGHYALGLGDATLANMTAIPASVFADNADVRLRVWVSTNGTAFEQLAPDRRLTSAGYALSAATVADPGVARLAGNNTFTGSITAAGFTGSGTGLTGVAKLAGSQTIDGTLTATGFVGSGAGLTGIPRLAGNNTFTGTLTATNFIGSGAGLTGLPQLAGGNAFTGNQTVGGTVSATGFAGSGAGLTGVALLGGNNTFSGTLTAPNFIGSGAGLAGVAKLTGNQTFDGVLTANGFVGSGAGLTGIPTLAGNNTFTGTLTAANFIGSGAGLTGIPTLGAINNTFTGTVQASAFRGTGLATPGNQPLVLSVNNVDGFRVQPNGTDTPNLIGGSAANTITGTASRGSVIAGGGNGAANKIENADNAVIGGGKNNFADEDDAVIGGGSHNRATGLAATVGGGNTNTAGGFGSTVAGGRDNTASLDSATVGGGQLNIASGYYATVPGGRDNTAGGLLSFAAGRRAKAAHTGAFVWADSQDADFTSTAADQFLIRASGYVGINKNNPSTALDVAGAVTATNFIGNGAGLTGLPLLAGSNTFTGNQTIGGTVTAANFIGSGAGLTGIPTLGAINNTFTGTVQASAFRGTGLATPGNQPLVLSVNNVDGFRVQPNGTDTPNLIGGSAANTITGTASRGSVIAGGGNGAANKIENADNAVIGGGKNNVVSAADSVIGGGAHNRASGLVSVVGGGDTNTAIGSYSTVAGGSKNTAGGPWAIVPGGENNTAAGWHSFAAGRRAKAANDSAFVWADSQDADFTSTAANQFLIRAAGNVGINKNNPATALDVAGTVTATSYNGSGAGLAGVAKLGANAFTGNQTVSGTVTATNFVGGGVDLTGVAKLSTNTFTGTQRVRDSVFVDFDGTNSGALFGQPSLIFGPGNSGEGIASKRTSGGNQYGLDFYTNYTSRMSIAGSGNVTMTGTCSALAFIPTSDRNAKENFTPVDPREVLDKVAALPLTRWNFKNDAATAPHLGPMAQDFHAAFGLGTDDRHIATVDADGVALAAIQGLNQKLEDVNQKLEEKGRAARAEKDRQIAALHGENASLKTENDALKERLARLEKAVATLAAARETTPPATPVAVATTTTGGTAQ